MTASDYSLIYVHPELPQMMDLSGSRNTVNTTRTSSLNARERIKVEKLEEALKEIGIEPSIEQQLELRTRLDVDMDCSVSYGDFVTVARQLFRHELLEKGQNGSIGKKGAAQLRQQVDGVPAPLVQTEYLQAEHERLMVELEQAQLALREKDKHCNRLETDILVHKNETKEALYENKSLKKKIHLSEQAQKAARGLEQDYEDVVKLLESENAQLRSQLSKPGGNVETSHHLASLSSELRRAEVRLKTYQVATEKLLHFANMVANNLDGPNPGAHNNNVAESGSGGKKRWPPQTIAQEAKDTIKIVKTLIEREPIR